MEKLSAALNGSLASKMLIVGYDYDIFNHMKEPVTVKDLAQKVECDERYLQEWCEGLHLSGYFECNKEKPNRFYLNNEMFQALIDMKPMVELIQAFTADKVRSEYSRTFKTGEPMNYNDYPNVGLLISNAMEGFYSDVLPPVLKSHPRITDMLNKPLKIADMGCGCGNSTLAMASIFPQANVHGLDIDKDSIIKAKANINHPNVTFVEKDMFDVNPDDEEFYDIICFFLCLHDMTWPTEALKITKRMLKPGGIVLVAESPAAKTFEEAPSSEATSVCISSMHCLPVSRPTSNKFQLPPEDIGNPFRMCQLEKCVTNSGFSKCEHVKHPKLISMALYLIT